MANYLLHTIVPRKPSQSLLASVLLGISRQPLAGSDLKFAAGIFKGECDPVRQALKLAATESLLHRTQLLTVPATPTTIAPAPAHPQYAPQLAGLLCSLLRALQAQLGYLPSQILTDHGLLVPAEYLLDLLEGNFRKQRIRSEAFSVLGARGLWLGSHHLSYKAKVSFLLKDEVPSEAHRRSYFAQYHLSNLALAGKQAKVYLAQHTERSLLCLQLLLSGYNVTPELSAWTIAAIRNSNSAVPLRQALIRCLRVFLGTSAVRPAQLTTLLNTIKAVATGGFELLRNEPPLILHAARALHAEDTQRIDELALTIAQSDDLLIRSHVGVLVLYSLLSPATYAHGIDVLRKRTLGAFSTAESAREKSPDVALFQQLLTVSPHSLSDGTSTELLTDLAHDTHLGANTSAFHWIAKLHANSLNTCLELAQSRSYHSGLRLLSNALSVKRGILDQLKTPE